MGLQAVRLVVAVLQGHRVRRHGHVVPVERPAVVERPRDLRELLLRVPEYSIFISVNIFWYPHFFSLEEQKSIYLYFGPLIFKKKHEFDNLHQTLTYH